MNIFTENEKVARATISCENRLENVPRHHSVWLNRSIIFDGLWNGLLFANRKINTPSPSVWNTNMGTILPANWLILAPDNRMAGNRISSMLKRCWMISFTRMRAIFICGLQTEIRSYQTLWTCTPFRRLNSAIDIIKNGEMRNSFEIECLMYFCIAMKSASFYRPGINQPPYCDSLRSKNHPSNSIHNGFN